ncbi:MAG: hypothetical protein WAO02_17285 [Verrucomicrobiia bacterium]
MKNMLAVLICLLPGLGYAVGGADDTPWPAGCTVEVQLGVTASNTNAQIHLVIVPTRPLGSWRDWAVV